MPLQWWRPDADKKPVLAHAMRGDLHLGPEGMSSACGVWWFTSMATQDYHGRAWALLQPGDSWCVGRCRRCEASVAADAKREAG